MHYNTNMNTVSHKVVCDRSPRSLALKEILGAIETGEFAVGDGIPSERALAERIGVSRVTVRSVLEHLEEQQVLARKGRQRVVRAEMIKPVSIMQKTVLLLTNLNREPNKLSIPHRHFALDLGILEGIRRRGLCCLTVFQDALGQDNINHFRLDPPQAVAAGYMTEDSPACRRLAAALGPAGVPLVVDSDEPQWQEQDRVISDHGQGARSLVEFLTERGCGRILQLGVDSPDCYWYRARRRGYEEGLAAAGLQPLPELVVKGLLPRSAFGPDDYDTRARQFAGFLADRLANTDEPADAVMCVSDSDVFYVAAACRLLGLEPNRDVAIVGYDNYCRECHELAWEPTLPLATVDKLDYRRGERLAELALQRANGELPEAPQRVVLNPELITL